jgi:hypothetical protein
LAMLAAMRGNNLRTKFAEKQSACGFRQVVYSTF